jgi:hypothetical protein
VSLRSDLDETLGRVLNGQTSPVDGRSLLNALRQVRERHELENITRQLGVLCDWAHHPYSTRQPLIFNLLTELSQAMHAALQPGGPRVIHQIFNEIASAGLKLPMVRAQTKSLLAVCGLPAELLDDQTNWSMVRTAMLYAISERPAGLDDDVPREQLRGAAKRHAEVIDAYADPHGIGWDKIRAVQVLAASDGYFVMLMLQTKTWQSTRLTDQGPGDFCSTTA